MGRLNPKRKTQLLTFKGTPSKQPHKLPCPEENHSVRQARPRGAFGTISPITTHGRYKGEPGDTTVMQKREEILIIFINILREGEVIAFMEQEEKATKRKVRTRSPSN